MHKLTKVIENQTMEVQGPNQIAANAAGMMPILIKRQDKIIEDNPLDFEKETFAKPNCNNDHIEKKCKTIYTLQELLYL